MKGQSAWKRSYSSVLSEIKVVVFFSFFSEIWNCKIFANNQISKSASWQMMQPWGELTRRRKKTDFLQHDFISSGAWPNQTVQALLLWLTYLLPAQPGFWSQEMAVEKSLAGPERPDNDPTFLLIILSCLHTQKLHLWKWSFPVCLGPTASFAFFLPTHSSSLSSDDDFLSVWVWARACCRLSNIDAFLSPPL